MTKIQQFLTQFIEDESGLSAVEYAIAGSLVVGGMVSAFISLGDSATIGIADLCDAVNGNSGDGDAACDS
ncbi:Flp family type IVb pilin [Paraferrimonas sedimenticola]|uniref:Pilus assembly protein Flp/PilA n=1 Tax=Paraferrimonas sedimenticola TaxID=375674 RepID=A0AA37RMH7_9GAMM|nr:Flp family type IVb pilin [Paraferrimonas sedimenticola]GLP94895.1 hypothetical protein GCM10007895_02010 [Paraferrimonas sedimenticola]